VCMHLAAESGVIRVRGVAVSKSLLPHDVGVL